MEGTGKNIITSKSRCITDPHMVLVFICFLIGMGVVLVTAINEGEIERIQYGMDYTGNSCGKSDRSDYKHQFWPNVLYYKQLGSVCLNDCPESPELFSWPSSGTVTAVCHCSAQVAVGNSISTGSVESDNVEESLNANNATSQLGQLCNSLPWSKLGYYMGNITVSSTSNNMYKYIAPAYTDPTANSVDGKLNIPLCNPVYRTKKVMNRCIPWIDYDTMKTMFCGDDGSCPSDNLADEFDGVATFF
jgi:hypothetical protein